MPLALAASIFSSASRASCRARAPSGGGLPERPSGPPPEPTVEPDGGGDRVGGGCVPEGGGELRPPSPSPSAVLVRSAIAGRSPPDSSAAHSLPSAPIWSPMRSKAPLPVRADRGAMLQTFRWLNAAALQPTGQASAKAKPGRPPPSGFKFWESFACPVGLPAGPGLPSGAFSSGGGPSRWPSCLNEVSEGRSKAESKSQPLRFARRWAMLQAKPRLALRHLC
mmetsp:Transcript_71223/g.154797  ORF Transcript_71223/g.154797 Transcript_71223/m.154797 type:complete len:223 (+) Transcript_71223:1576-2244(+)